MEEAAMIEKLLQFGLGRQEALIYLCLVKNGELTGYEVAKLTGISRSNVYNGLASLVEHGGAYVIEGVSTKYIAVTMEELCDNRIRYLKRVKEELLKNGPKPMEASEGYITIEGYRHICDKIHHMLRGTKQRIYFSAAAEFLEGWQEEIEALLAREIKVVLIAERPPSFAGCVIFYQSNVNREKQFRLIIDSEYVLTGEAAGNGGDTGLYSAQKNFVNVFKEAMSNEIKLIEMSAGERQ